MKFYENQPVKDRRLLLLGSIGFTVFILIFLVDRVIKERAKETVCQAIGFANWVSCLIFTHFLITSIITILSIIAIVKFYWTEYNS